MAHRRLIWKVAPAYVMAITLCTVAVGWFAGESVRGFYLAQAEHELETTVRLVAPQALRLVAAGQTHELQSLCRLWGQAAGVRLTVIDPTGQVLGDSYEDPPAMDNLANRPEVLTAMGGKPGRSTRYSQTHQTQMVYVAQPVQRNGQTVAVIRAAVASSNVQSALWDVYGRIALGGVVMAALAVTITLMAFNRHISRPLRYLQAGARRFAEGKLSRQLPVPESQEIGSLAAAMNTMARRLDETIREITEQSQEHQAILESMVEGVLAVDADERIITLNDAAAGFLGVDAQQAPGKSIYEAIRHFELQQFIAHALASQKSTEGEISLHVDGQERCLGLQASGLPGTHGDRAGVVVVLQDRTRLRQLENVRQQFVANVSHELKTPISAVKAAAETLLDLQQDSRSQSAHFLGMIARHADRLGAIIDDLLSLARIEQQSEHGQVELKPDRLEGVLRRAVENCQAAAEAKKIQLTLLGGDDDCRALINAPLLEQAVTNLLDNAVKYCPPGTEVRVGVSRSPSRVMIEVSDNGPGIAADHLPRIFERFYRTDNARSRELGGTGLGLAIVKHIANAHGGNVSVESICGNQPGHGCVFRISLQPA